MKILLCHNHYQQSGGEDSVFAAESDLLQRGGHEVVRYTRHNDDIQGAGRLRAAASAVWNESSRRALHDLIRAERPEVMHCTNLFPLISPAAYDAAHAAGVAVVQSLHNYRMFCANALCHRYDEVCEQCVGKTIPWPALRYACYRGSRVGTAAVVGMQVFHRLRGTWQRRVDRYIALSQFSRRKFVEGGLPADRIVVKPNFVPDPGFAGTGRGNYAVFVGRLSEEKGIARLLAAWERVTSRIPLVIVGDGPLAAEVSAAASRDPRIDGRGRQPLEEVLRIIGDAACLVTPSTCFEHFPRAIVEAYAVGTPVLASRLGAMAELVDDGVTGACFDPHDPADLAACVERFFRDAAGNAARRSAARATYEQHYTEEANLAQLESIYREAIAARRAALPVLERPVPQGAMKA